ncbi:hypothetical protein I3760_07G070300 [Carya illinoinensis]|nr:hypothetical protein I3760_07G070300 [Carya illinoinensis]
MKPFLVEGQFKLYVVLRFFTKILEGKKLVTAARKHSPTLKTRCLKEEDLSHVCKWDNRDQSHSGLGLYNCKILVEVGPWPIYLLAIWPFDLLFEFVTMTHRRCFQR